MANIKDRGAKTGTSTSTRDMGTEPELDDTMLCDYDPCTCEDADVERGGQKFCSERCADMANQAAGAEEMEAVEEEDTCLCGHAECETSISAGAGEEGAGRQPSRTPPGRRT